MLSYLFDKMTMYKRDQPTPVIYLKLVNGRLCNGRTFSNHLAVRFDTLDQRVAKRGRYPSGSIYGTSRRISKPMTVSCPLDTCLTTTTI